MASTKSKKDKSRSSEPKHEMKQVILTFSASKGDVVKVETFAASGQREELSEREFAEFAGEDEIKDLEQALEEAYAAGVRDAIEDSDDDISEGDEHDFQRIVVREAAARHLLRRGLRRLILRRALQRGPAQQKSQSRHNGAHGAHKH